MQAHPKQENGLSEFAIIGIGRASASLSSMMHEDIALTIISAGLYDHDQFPDKLAQTIQGDVHTLEKNIQGKFNVRMILFMEENEIEKFLELLKIEKNTPLPVEITSEEAFTEAGTVILRAILDSLKGLLNINLKVRKSKTSLKSIEEYAASIRTKKEDTRRVLWSKLEFLSSPHKVYSHIAIVMENQDMHELYEIIQKKKAY